MSNRWDDAKIYKIGHYKIYVLRSRPEDPPRFYTELHRMSEYGDAYLASRGSHMPFYWMAALEMYLKCRKKGALL